MTVTVDPYGAPASVIEEPVETIPVRLASRGRRLGAQLLDGVFMFLIFGMLAAVAGVAAVLAGFDLDGIDPERMGLLAGLVIAPLWIVINLPLLRHGQTIGKKLLRIRIVRPDGSPAGIPRIVFLRFAPFWILNLVPVLGRIIGLVDSLAIFRENHRCLHDDIAGTIVVSDDPAAALREKGFILT